MTTARVLSIFIDTRLFAGADGHGHDVHERILGRAWRLFIICTQEQPKVPHEHSLEAAGERRPRAWDG